MVAPGKVTREEPVRLDRLARLRGDLYRPHPEVLTRPHHDRGACVELGGRFTDHRVHPLERLRTHPVHFVGGIDPYRMYAVRVRLEIFSAIFWAIFWAHASLYPFGAAPVGNRHGRTASRRHAL